MLLREALAAYLAANQRVQSPKTMAGYHAILRHFADHLGRDATTEDLTDVAVGGWIRHRLTQVSRNTANGEAATLLAFWRWCALHGHCKPPTIRPPSRTRKTPQALTEEQVVALWRAAANSPMMLGSVPGSIYWPALLYVLWQTAERIGAVRALDWRCLDLDSGWVVFPASTRKGGVQDLPRPLTRSAVAALVRLREVSPDAPFAALAGSGWYAHWHALTASAGLPEWVTPHTIRKSVASHLPSLDAACEMLGHSSQSITQRSYRDPRVSRGKRLVDKLFDPGRRRWWMRLA